MEASKLVVEQRPKGEVQEALSKLAALSEMTAESMTTLKIRNTTNFNFKIEIMKLQCAQLIIWHEELSIRDNAPQELGSCLLALGSSCEFSGIMERHGEE